MTMFGVYWLFIGVWLVGLLMEDTNVSKVAKDIHLAFRTMWSIRLQALGCAVVTVAHCYMYAESWSNLHTAYLIWMQFVFLLTAKREYLTRRIFVLLYQVNELKLKFKK